MKKTLFKTIILVLIATLGITSCSEDYDDADVKKGITDNATSISTLKTQSETLNAQLTALQAAYEALPTDEDLANLETSLETKISDLKTDIDNRIAAIQVLVAANTDDINAIEDMVAVNKTEIEAISIDLTSLKADVTANTADIDANTADIDANTADIDANTALIKNIQDAINALDYKEMLTKLSVIYDENTDKYAYLSFDYIKMVNDADFGVNGDIFKLQKAGQNGYYPEFETVMLQANPVEADLTDYSLKILNSQDTVPGLTITSASKYNELLTGNRAAAPVNAKSNLYTIGFNMDYNALVEESKSYEFFTRYFGNDTKAVLYGVSATKESRTINSDYKIAFNRNLLAIPTTFDYSVTDSPCEFFEGTPKDDQYITVSFVSTSGNKGILKQYVTLTDPTSYDADDFIGLNELHSGDENFKIACSNKDYVNDMISIDIHYLNYDGSRGVVTKTIKFTQKIYEDATINLTSVINRSTVNAKQTTDTLNLANALSSKIPSIATWASQFDFITIQGYDNNGAMSALPNGTPIDIIDNNGTILSTNVNSSIPVFATEDDMNSIKVTYDANNITAVGHYGAKLTFYHGGSATTGDLVNIVYLDVEVKDTDANKYVNKVTSAWNSELTINNIWAQIDATGLIGKYNMATSYNGDLANVEFVSTDSKFDVSGTELSISDASSIVDNTVDNYAAKSLYKPFMDNNWAITDIFKIHVKSPIYEAEPIFDAPKSLAYTDGGQFTLDHNSIKATDPSASNTTIYYIGDEGTLATTNTGTNRDFRIEKTEFTIVDPEATNLSSNVGLVEIDNTTDPNSITIKSKAINAQYPALASDVTLNLVMKVTDKFGFVQTSTFQFTVKKTMN